MTWAAVFLVFAFVLFVLAAINLPSARVSLGWAGLAFLTLYLFFGGSGLVIH